MRKVIFCSLFIFALSFSSCEKEDLREFEAKWGVFKCKIDGKTFRPSSTVGGNVKPITVSYCPTGTEDYFNYPPGYFSIQGIDYNYEITGNVCIQKIGVFGVGEYPLTYQECDNFYSCDASWYCKDNEWNDVTKEGNYYAENGKLTITELDTVARRISGTFYFNTKDVKGRKKRITNGAFNVKYSLIKSDGFLEDISK